MNARIPARAARIAALAATFAALAARPAAAADHNDPNATNSIFSDVAISGADLYDLFGFPAPDSTQGERVVTALTFASVPAAGRLDPDLLYRLRFNPAPRPAPAEEMSLESMLTHFEAIKEKYLRAPAAEVRVVASGEESARLSFHGFPAGDFGATVALDQVETVAAPDGASIKVFVGGRDDAFFNDLPGFFRSINYAPQFYRVPRDRPDLRELPIPKTLIELEGNRLFNFDPARPLLGRGVKEDLPTGPYGLAPERFAKDADGNYRFVYSGADAQAGININAIVLEMPLSFVTRSPDIDRIVNVWGESWVLRAAARIEDIPDDPGRSPSAWAIPSALFLLGGVVLFVALWTHTPLATGRRTTGIALLGGILILVGVGVVVRDRLTRGPAPERNADAADAELLRYKRVDTDGQPFADAALNERENERQVGADNVFLGISFVRRLGHLGWGFGPSVSALGLAGSFDHDHAPVSVHRTYASAAEAFPRVRRMLFQRLNMPDDSWNPRHLAIPLRRPFEIFVPNVCAIDMDTTGTWPFGRRLEDQVATRFLSLFLDMSATIQGRPYHVDLLGDPAVWAAAPITPKTPPNPLANDKPFLAGFPYLAEPW